MKAEGKRLLGIAVYLQGNEKIGLAFRLKVKNHYTFMAKSIRLNDAAELDPSMAALPSHGFWEHWFDMQPVKHPAPEKIDEHGIWERAVSLEILAMNETKY
jgi:hypothetical protein